MNRYEFKTQVDRLVNVYGEKAYPPERTDQLWYLVKDLPVADFDRIVGSLIADNYSAPMYKKFYDECQPMLTAIREKRSRELQDRAAETKCKKCNSTGIVSAFYKPEPRQSYSFRCNACDVAEILELSQKIPMWSDDRKKEYFPMYDLGEYEVTYKNYGTQVASLARGVFAKVVNEPSESDGEIIGNE